jgi:adenine-specific DNA-methyltransferase
VFFVNDSEHAAQDPVVFFAPDVPEPLIKTIAAKSPLRAVVRDQRFTTNAYKINVEQISKTINPQNQLKSL